MNKPKTYKYFNVYGINTPLERNSNIIEKTTLIL